MDSVVAAEDLAAWQAYLRWHLLHAQARWLPSQFVDEDFNFYGRTMTGQQELQPRWKRCVRYTDRALGDALGQAYVEIAFGPAAKQRALTMVQQVEAAMERDINQLTWMSQPTKQQALDKLHAVREQDRLSRPLARLYRAQRGAGGCDWQRPAGQRVRIPASAEQDRQTRGPRRVVSDPADGERQLRFAEQRHQLPCRSSAAAGCST